ncbi:hypothetical protein ACIQZI_19405 [Peribacillus sp. NPDC096379]
MRQGYIGARGPTAGDSVPRTASPTYTRYALQHRRSTRYIR